MPVAPPLHLEHPLVGLRGAGITTVIGRETAKRATIHNAPVATAAPAIAQVEMAIHAPLLVYMFSKVIPPMAEPNGPRRRQSHATSLVESVAVAVPTKTESAEVKTTDPELKTETLAAEIATVTMIVIAVIASATPIVSVAVTTAVKIEPQIVIETVEIVPRTVNETANALAATDPHLPMVATTHMPDA